MIPVYYLFLLEKSKLRAIPLSFLILSFLILLSFGCVTAPSVDRARILPEQEVNALTLVKRAKDLAATGRHDLAEQDFRSAIRLLPKQSSVFNDLGVALMAQNRFSESGEMFQRAYQLDSSNAVALENYAKVLYRDREYFFSIVQFSKLIDLLYTKSEDEIKKSSGQVYGNAEFVNILRNMASANFALGYFDESLCLSNEALLRSPDLYQVGVHSRLLLTFEKVDECYTVLNNTITLLNGAVTPGMMLDYSITLYLRGDLDKAVETVDSALKNPQINSEEKKIAILTSYLILEAQKKDKEAESLAISTVENNIMLCDSQELMKNSYLPAGFEDQLKVVRGRVCKIQSSI